MIDWQTPVTLMIVTAAAGYLAYHCWQSLSTPESTGCNSCSKNSSETGVQAKQLISMDDLMSKARKR